MGLYLYVILQTHGAMELRVQLAPLPVASIHYFIFIFGGGGFLLACLSVESVLLLLAYECGYLSPYYSYYKPIARWLCKLLRPLQKRDESKSRRSIQ